MVLLDLPIFTLVIKKAQQNFSPFRFEVPIHKFFSKHTFPLKIFHLELYLIVQYYFHSPFQKVTKVCSQVA